MRNFVSGLSALVLFIAMAIYCQTYERENCEIVKVDTASGVVTACDTMGYLWDFEGTEFQVGDSVTLKMRTNGTDSPFDDYVVDVKF